MNPLLLVSKTYDIWNPNNGIPNLNEIYEKINNLWINYSSILLYNNMKNYIEKFEDYDKFVLELLLYLKNFNFIKIFDEIKFNSRIKKYEIGDDWNWHVDCSFDKEKEPILLLGIILQEPKLGGELCIKENNEIIEFIPKKGDVFLINRFRMHCIKPILEGERIVKLYRIYGITEYME
jgi:hypothetical protein